ncbi:MAG TPA: Ty1/Copia family ribonuclease HI [Candidatus Babeliaceae bacterium]|nr:Ty1/Copia family ribonuclease HI [Candidatus Babeliaceae bacterium]
MATPLEAGCRLSKSDCPSTAEEISEMKNIPYQSAVGAIMYAMLGTRPDISFAVTILSQFSNNPGKVHWNAVKRVLRYLNGSVNRKLVYGGRNSRQMDPELIGYCDADWASNVDDRRSVTGYVFMLAGSAISWKTKKQPTVALSSVEAEYMAATQATKEAIWFRQFFAELGMVRIWKEPTVIFSDSQGSIALVKNPEYHQRTKHIDIQHHFVREKVDSGEVVFKYIATEFMVADVFTKALSRNKHLAMIKLMGISLQ